MQLKGHESGDGMAYRLGVDMGTTFTAAAVANGISPTLVGLGNRALQIPSVLFLTEEGDFLVGEAAEHRALADPARVVREFKRRIGDTVPVLVGGAPYSPQTLTARLLRHVVAVAAERMGGPPDRLVLTHPANWGPYKLDLLDQVAVLAGLGRVERISEPLAAAAQYANQERVPVGETIAVYDLGGGTFDACVLRKDPDGFTVLGRPEGIEHLGGIDFDEALFHHVLDRLDTSVNDASLDDKGALNGLARLRRDCVDAKEALSTDTRTTVPIMLPGLSTTLTLERAELEELIRPALAETMLAMRRTIDSAGIEPSQLRAIVLVGGSSRIPLVRELVKAQFDVSVALDTHPKHDVALGAVRAAAAAPRSPQHSEALPSAPPPAIVPKPPGPPTEVDSGRKPRRPRRTVALAMVGVAVAGALVVTVSLTTLRPAHSSAGAGLPVVSSAEAGPSVEPPTPVTSSPPPVTWSLPASPPLGRDELLVAREVGTSWELYRANAASTTPGRQLTRRAGINSAPVLSPDRRTVIYIRIDTAGRRTLRVAGADDLNHDRLLFTLPAGCDRPLRPAWNPADASLLAVGCRDGAGRTTLRLMRPDGTDRCHRRSAEGSAADRRSCIFGRRSPARILGVVEQECDRRTAVRCRALRGGARADLLLGRSGSQPRCRPCIRPRRRTHRLHQA